MGGAAYSIPPDITTFQMYTFAFSGQGSAQIRGMVERVRLTGPAQPVLQPLPRSAILTSALAAQGSRLSQKVQKMLLKCGLRALNEGGGSSGMVSGVERSQSGELLESSIKGILEAAA